MLISLLRQLQQPVFFFRSWGQYLQFCNKRLTLMEPNIELSCPADHRTAATFHSNCIDSYCRHPRGQLQRFVMHSRFPGIPRPFHPSSNSARRLFDQSRNPLPSQTTLAHGVSYRKHEAFCERQRPPSPASSNRSALRFVKRQVRVLKRRALPSATDAVVPYT